jgi:hypothetical protein
MLYLLNLQKLELNAVDGPGMDSFEVMGSSQSIQNCSNGCCSSLTLLACC